MNDEAISVLAIIISVLTYSTYYFIVNFKKIIKMIDIKIQKLLKIFSIILLFIVLMSIFISIGILLLDDFSL